MALTSPYPIYFLVSSLHNAPYTTGSGFLKGAVSFLSSELPDLERIKPNLMHTRTHIELPGSAYFSRDSWASGPIVSCGDQHYRVLQGLPPFCSLVGSGRQLTPLVHIYPPSCSLPALPSIPPTPGDSLLYYPSCLS